MAVGVVVGGPIGAAVGGLVGAIAGGLAGKGAAESVNPTIEDAYWRDNYKTRPYIAGGSYDAYQPAYQHGWESYDRYGARKFDESEADLRRDWENTKHAAELSWDKAKPATRDAWERVERNVHAGHERVGY